MDEMISKNPAEVDCWNLLADFVGTLTEFMVVSFSFFEMRHYDSCYLLSSLFVKPWKHISYTADSRSSSWKYFWLA